jgi:hypothetical protein
VGVATVLATHDWDARGPNLLRSVDLLGLGRDDDDVTLALEAGVDGHEVLTVEVLVRVDTEGGDELFESLHCVPLLLCLPRHGTALEAWFDMFQVAR